MKSSFLRLLFVGLILTIGWAKAQGQDIGSRDKKTVLWVQRAISEGNYLNALTRLDALTEKYPENNYLTYLKVICLSNHPQSSYHKETLPLIEKLLQKPADAPQRTWFYKGLNLFRLGKYEDAVVGLNEFLARPAASDTNFVKAANEIKRWCFNQKELADEVNQAKSLINLGSNFNTNSSEYAPLADDSDSILIFTSLRSGNPKERTLEREYPQIALKKGDVWSEPNWLRIPVNSPNISGVSLTPDGKSAVFYVSDEDGNGDLFRMKLDSSNSPLEALNSQINSDHTEGSAFVSADGNSIYFSSSRPGGFGGRDIYALYKNANGDWDQVVNLGTLVNTAFDEDAPYLSDDGKVLFFQSKGHNSIGGYDLFRCVKIGEKWSAPINLGSPFNTPYNDAYLSLSRKGTKVYLTSDRPGGFGEQDLYSGVLPNDIHIFPFSVARIQTDVPEKDGPCQIQLHAVSGRKPFVQKIDNNLHTAVLEPGNAYVLEWTAPAYGTWYYPFTVPLQRRIYDLFFRLKVKDILQFGVKAGERTELTADLGPTSITEISNNPTDTSGLAVMLAAEALEDGLPDIKGCYSNTLKKFSEDPASRPSAKTWVNEYYLDEEAANRSEIQTLSKKVKGKLLTEKNLLKQSPIEVKKVEPVNNTTKKQGKFSGMGASFVEATNKIVLFEVGKADILPQYNAVLDKATDELLREPNARVEVYGYTDATGNDIDNKELSDRRANAVIDYLLNKGLKRRRIDAFPMGVAAGSTGSNAEDRRVELKIVTETR